MRKRLLMAGSRSWIVLLIGVFLAATLQTSPAYAEFKFKKTAPKVVKKSKKAKRPKKQAQKKEQKSSPSDSRDADFDEFESDSAREGKSVSDPLGGYNRFMFHVNDKFYYWIARPIARGYKIILPQPVRVAIDRSFHNIGFPIRFLSSALQGKFKKAGKETGRFVVNSTLGIGGLFDPADHWMGLRTTDEDLGQTFGHWGIGSGFPIVLPILGQTNLRDGIGMIPNSFLNPVYYAASYRDFYAVTAANNFNYLSLHMEEYEQIKKDALDPYTFMRDAYDQNRKKKIKE